MYMYCLIFFFIFLKVLAFVAFEVTLCSSVFLYTDNMKYSKLVSVIRSDSFKASVSSINFYLTKKQVDRNVYCLNNTLPHCFCPSDGGLLS